MRDFTFKAYREYIIALKNSVDHFLTFEEFIPTQDKAENFCLIRHDVDRKPINALKMAKIENELNVKATYYFRYKPNTFKKEIIKEISSLGHEIGYHYENLSDTNGDFDKALKDFESNLNEFRKITPIRTISMHGRPLKPYDNRDLWKDPTNNKLLSEKYDLLGEVYLHIDYSDIAYINDTGRNWTNDKSNVRDKVNSNIDADFNTSEEMKSFLKNPSTKKICFQIHPERWDDNIISWSSQYLKDYMINLAKVIVKKIS